jgi:hypothetical protein
MLALSVSNPWAWALVTRHKNGLPFKPGENRITPLWTKQANQWTLIQVGLHKPDPMQVAAVRSIAEAEGIAMPTWAAYASTAKQAGKPIGVIIGAVRFVGDRDPDDVHGYAAQWVSDGATHFWEVGDCVMFDHYLPCKGRQAPLFFEVPEEVNRRAETELKYALEESGL